MANELKRDEHNRLDRDDAKERTDKLMKELIETERQHQKDISFNLARGKKRDFVVFITIFMRNSVDGKIVIGDNEESGFFSLNDKDPYKYKDYDCIDIQLPARLLPMKRAQLGKALMSGFNVLVNWLARIGAVDGV